MEVVVIVGGFLWWLFTREPDVPDDVRARVEARVNECVATLRQQYPEALADAETPAIRYETGKRNGAYRYSENTIFLNAEKVQRYTDGYMVQTIPHEVAHWFARHTDDPDAPSHGQFFKIAAEALGVEPKRGHNYAEHENDAG